MLLIIILCFVFNLNTVETLDDTLPPHSDPLNDFIEEELCSGTFEQGLLVQSESANPFSYRKFVTSTSGWQTGVRGVGYGMNALSPSKTTELSKPLSSFIVFLNLVYTGQSANLLHWSGTAWW